VTDRTYDSALALPDASDRDALADLAAGLAADPRASIRLDATGIRSVGALAAQAVLVAARARASTGATVRIVDPDGRATASFAVMGLSRAAGDALVFEGPEA
jgi:hypothetical protein